MASTPRAGDKAYRPVPAFAMGACPPSPQGKGDRTTVAAPRRPSIQTDPARRGSRHIPSRQPEGKALDVPPRGEKAAARNGFALSQGLPVPFAPRRESLQRGKPIEGPSIRTRLPPALYGAQGGCRPFAFPGDQDRPRDALGAAA